MLAARPTTSQGTLCVLRAFAVPETTVIAAQLLSRARLPTASIRRQAALKVLALAYPAALALTPGTGEVDHVKPIFGGGTVSEGRFWDQRLRSLHSGRRRNGAGAGEGGRQQCPGASTVDGPGVRRGAFREPVRGGVDVAGGQPQRGE